MKRLAFAPQARADLADIARYIAQEDPERAMSFLAELEQRALDAARAPRTFPPRDDISRGLRAARHGSYLLLFRELPNEVRIVRVAHGKRDLRRMFRP